MSNTPSQTTALPQVWIKPSAFKVEPDGTWRTPAIACKCRLMGFQLQGSRLPLPNPETRYRDKPSMSEATLYEMMRDPRYWRQRDPEWIARVTKGFRELYA